MPSPGKMFQPAAPPPTAMTMDSDIIVILAALLCALICVVGLALVARCTWIRRSSGGRDPQMPANKGLKKKVLRSLPKTSFSATPSGPSPDCPICLAEFLDGDQIRVLPLCGHVFHVSCVDTWLASHSSCPSCRQLLVVARCLKCGNCPTPEADVKSREDHRVNIFLP